MRCFHPSKYQVFRGVTVSDLASLWVWKQDSHLYSRNHGDNLSEVFTRISDLLVCDNSNLFLLSKIQGRLC